MRYFFFYCLSLFFVAGNWLAAEPDLIPLGPFGGDVRSLAVHRDRPDRVFLGTADGQLFVSTDAGQYWQKLDPGLDKRQLVIDNLVFHPYDPDTLYAAGWELRNNLGSLFRTRDGGETWQEIPLGKYHSSAGALAVAPADPNIIALGISEGVILSRDEGETWERITRGYRSLYNVRSLAFDPIDPNVLYVGTWRLAWKTPDLGGKWQAIHSGMYWDSDLFTLLVDPRTPQTIYASACSGIYKSLNQGDLWIRLKNGIPDEAIRTRALQFDSSNPDILYAGTTAGLYRSTDSGASWTLLKGDLVVNSVIVHPQNSDLLLVGTEDAGVIRSTDGGKSFEMSNQGFIHRQVTSVVTRPDTWEIFASVTADRQYGGFFFSQDGGQTWDSFNQGLGQSVAGIQTMLAGRFKVFLATSDGLFTGVPPEEPWHKIEATNGIAVLDLDFANHDQSALFLATKQGVFHLDIESGRLKTLSIEDYDRQVSTLLFDPTSGQIFAGTSEGVFRSDNGGKTWAARNHSLPQSSITRLHKVGDRLFAGTRKGLFFTDDGAETWQPARGIFPVDIMAIQSSPHFIDHVFAADFLVGYLFVSDDQGNSWRTYDLGNKASRISSLTFTAEGTLLAGTVSEGILRIEMPN